MVGRWHVFRFEDGDARTLWAEVAVRADRPEAALDALAAVGMHAEQLWDRGRTPCGPDAGTDAAVDALGVDLAVRRHLHDGTVTDWEPLRHSLDRRRQPRRRAATSAAQ